jgi:hypothetical protein
MPRGLSRFALLSQARANQRYSAVDQALRRATRFSKIAPRVASEPPTAERRKRGHNRHDRPVSQAAKMRRMNPVSAANTFVTWCPNSHGRVHSRGGDSGRGDICPCMSQDPYPYYRSNMSDFGRNKSHCHPGRCIPYMYTHGQNLGALSRPTQFAISENALWKRHAFGVVNSWLDLILVGP